MKDSSPSEDADYLSLSEAAKRTPTRPSLHTLWRWCRKGIKARSGERVHLPHVRIGGKIFIPGGQQTLDTFFAAISERDMPHLKASAPESRVEAAPPKKIQRDRARRIERAEEALKKAGF